MYRTLLTLIWLTKEALRLLLPWDRADPRALTALLRRQCFLLLVLSIALYQEDTACISKTSNRLTESNINIAGFLNGRSFIQRPYGRAVSSRWTRSGADRRQILRQYVKVVLTSYTVYDNAGLLIMLIDETSSP